MAAENQDDALCKEMKRRVHDAEQDRQRHITAIEGCYKYGLPWRHQANQTQSPAASHLDDVFDNGLTMTVLEDFSADMLNTFTPAKSPWVEPKPIKTLDAGDARQLKEPLKRRQEIIFGEMLRSNLYQALQESYLDLGPGTMALTVQDRHPSEPIHCEAIPLTDLLLERGPWGDVNGRFRKWKCTQETIRVRWPKARPINDKWDLADRTEYEVIDGLWRDWTARGTVTWRYVVMVKGSKILFDTTFKGRGSCPLIVARWSKDPTTAWGVGPTYRVLPAIRALNHIKYLGLKNLDKITDPVTSYEDDGVLNLDHGIDPGTWLPRAVGSTAPEVIEPKGRFDVEWAKIDEIVSEIRRAHYQDRPEQQGKTPPTATQWADEAAQRARRMGTPATNLVVDLQYELYYRFEYLLERRGVLPPIELNGERVALQPISPLLRAQEQEEVVRSDKFLEMLGVRFGPEAVNAIVKQTDYATWLAEKMGVDPKLVRTEAEMAATIEKLAPLFAGGAGGEMPSGPVPA